MVGLHRRCPTVNPLRSAWQTVVVGRQAATARSSLPRRMGDADRPFSRWDRGGCPCPRRNAHRLPEEYEVATLIHHTSNAGSAALGGTD